MSINRVTISGNLTRDPSLRQTQSGMAVLGFGVAVNDRRKNNQTGEWEDYPNFVDCTMFGNRAESISRYLVKGTKVAIEGKLRWSQWERDGQKRSKLEVIVDEIEFMHRQSDSAAPVQQPAQPYAQQYQTPAQAAPQYAQPQYQQPAQPQQPQAQSQIIDAPASVYDQNIPF